MYDKKFISVTSHALDPSPCHTFPDSLPHSSVTYFMDGPSRKLPSSERTSIAISSLIIWRKINNKYA